MRTTIILLSILVLTSCSVTDYQFTQLFEEYTDLTFPPSGKIILNDNDEAWKSLDPYYIGIIELDSLDYMTILHEVQARADSFSTDDVTYVDFVSMKKGTSEDYVYYYEEHHDSFGKRFNLWFHKNNRIIRCTMESI
jgi:hypothetical protein